MTDLKRGACWGALAAGGVLCSAVGASTGDVSISGSAYVDWWVLSDKTARASALSGPTPEIAVKLEADVHENLSFTAKACFGCHGLEVDRAYLEYTPKSWFNLQAGRVVVPFGDFSVRYDPANHRTASKPLPFEMGRMPYFQRSVYNLGVVPAPYVDTGVVVYGQTWPTQTVQLWYAGYAIGGLRGENDIDYSSMHTPFYVDNNRTPSGGARAVLTWSSDNAGAVLRDVSFGLSGMHGRYNRGLSRAYTTAGADLSVRLGPATVRGEAAFSRFDIDPSAPGYRYEVIDPFVDKSGFYVEVEHPLGDRLFVVYRFDGLRRAGVPLPGSDVALSPDSRVLRYTQGAQVAISDALFAKLTYEHWWLVEFPDFDSGHLGVGGTF
jgi:hypothetical protein